MKGNRKILFCQVSGICAEISANDKDRGKKVVLLDDVWYSAEVEFDCVDSRITYVMSGFAEFV